MIANKRYKFVALHNCKYICKIKAKATKILKCIKTLLTVKTLKIYAMFHCQQQLDQVWLLSLTAKCCIYFLSFYC